MNKLKNAVTNVVKIKTVQLSFQFHPLKVIIGLSLVVDYESYSSALEKLKYLIWTFYYGYSPS